MNNSEIKENVMSPEMIDYQFKNPLGDISKLQPPSPGMLPFLRILVYLSSVIFIASGIAIFVLPSEVKSSIVLLVSIGLFIFLVFVDGELNRNYDKKSSEYDVLKATNMYINASQLEESPKIPQIMQGVEAALTYTQRLIKKNKETNKRTAFFYYSLQIVTIIFSAVTPILVLVEKSDTTPLWVIWLPVIFPGVASVVASISTAFPLEEYKVASKKAINDLEAEKEKFLLAVTEGYRIPRNANEKVQYKMTRDAMAKFMNKVSNVHLQQLQDQEKTEKTLEEGEEEQSKN